MDFASKFDHREPEEGFSPEELKEVLESTGQFAGVSNIERLSGGFSHLNYKFEAGKEAFVLRISDRSRREFEAENSILEKLAGTLPVPKVVFAETDHPLLKRHICVQEFIPGQLLSVAEDGMTDKEAAEIGVQLGKILAKIHSHEFPKSGFLGAGMQVEEPFTSYIDGYFGYMDDCLNNKLLEQRLGADTFVRLKCFIHEHQEIRNTLPRTQNLTHGDFNQKNIMVRRQTTGWQVVAILDWEFSYAGCPLEDFGNFFRYENEMNSKYRKPLIGSYLEAGGIFSDNWREQARYLDLLSMIQFLIQEGDYPKTFATARGVVERTVN